MTKSGKRPCFLATLLRSEQDAEQEHRRLLHLHSQSGQAIRALRLCRRGDLFHGDALLG